MHAVVATAFGPPSVLQLREVPDPVPGRGEVRVDVAVADVLWLETMVRSGAGRDHWPHRPPYVPGGGVAGVVGAVGSEADPALVGTLVAVSTGSAGGYAEQVVAPAGALVPVPAGVDAVAAAAVLHDGVTALALDEVTRPGPGDAVVILGASGGLGIASVRLAQERGARVVAVARGPKLARVAELHVDAAVDSDSPTWPVDVRTALGGSGAAVVLDNVGGELGEAALELVAPGGRFSAHGTPSGRFAAIDRAAAAARGVTVTGIEAVQFVADDRTRLLAAALTLVAEGALEPVVGQSFPLADAAAAHTAIERRSVFGKTLLTVGR